MCAKEASFCVLLICHFWMKKTLSSFNWLSQYFVNDHKYMIQNILNHDTSFSRDNHQYLSHCYYRRDIWLSFVSKSFFCLSHGLYATTPDLCLIWICICKLWLVLMSVVCLLCFNGSFWMFINSFERSAGWWFCKSRGIGGNKQNLM